jgi:hypothetical protein
LVTLAARIAVDTLMLAPTIQVHVVFQSEPGIGLFHMRQHHFGLDWFDHGHSPAPHYTPNAVILCNGRSKNHIGPMENTDKPFEPERIALRHHQLPKSNFLLGIFKKCVITRFIHLFLSNYHIFQHPKEVID